MTIFEHLQGAEPDQFLVLVPLFRAEDRSDKLDPGVGDYSNATAG